MDKKVIAKKMTHIPSGIPHMEGKPSYGNNGSVEVYRGMSKKYMQNKLKHGDFVTTDKSRASQYGNVKSFKVPAKKLLVADPEAVKLGLHTKSDLIYKHRG